MVGLFVAIAILVNLGICLRYYLKEDGVFQAPFIIAIVFLLILSPQLIAMYNGEIYPNELLPMLCYTLITCNLAFCLGFEYAKRMDDRHRFYFCLDLHISRIKPQLAVFVAMGLYSIVMYKTAWGIREDAVVAASFKGMALLAMAISLSYIIHENGKSRYFWICLLLSILPIINFIVFIKGSRGDSLVLGLSFLYLLNEKMKIRSSVIKVLFLSFFFVGCVMSSSITTIRNAIKGNEEARAALFTVDGYIGNYKNAFIQDDYKHGLDLGNAAKGIAYVREEGFYDKGAFIWNGFVQDFIPQRLYGVDAKSALKIKTPKSLSDKVGSLTHGVTTRTGYYAPFAAFGVFGFVLYWIVGYLLGKVWCRKQYSSFYSLLYLVTIGYLPTMITHSLQYVFNRIEFLAIVSLSFFYAYYWKDIDKDEIEEDEIEEEEMIEE